MHKQLVMPDADEKSSLAVNKTAVNDAVGGVKVNNDVHVSNGIQMESDSDGDDDEGDEIYEQIPTPKVRHLVVYFLHAQTLKVI